MAVASKDTTFAGTLSNWFGVAGLTSSVIGSYYSAKNQQSALRHKGRMADINARISELGAQSALKRGEREQQASRIKTSQLKGSQRAAMAANGIDLGSETALNILTSTDYLGEVDANTIEANAIATAWGYRMQGVNSQNEAAISRATAGAISPGMAASTTLLGDAGTVARRWY